MISERRRLRGTLAWRLARWIAASTFVSLSAFAVTAYVVVRFEEEAEPDRDSDEVMSAEAWAEVSTAMVIATPLGLSLAVLSAFLLTRRALRPLDDVVAAAARITPRALHERLPLPAADDEVRAAVLALNGLLDRLATGFASLDRFAANASHELRTPLAVLETELEVALRNPRSVAEWEAVATTSVDEVRHLARLVETLLRTAQAESRTSLRRGPVDVEQLIAHALAGVASQARARGVTLVGPAGEGAGGAELEGDADALASVLANLVDNAVRFTPRGGNVRVSWLREPTGALALHVDDSGPGIDPAEAERIFEPFARGSAARGEAVATGTGLGLAIARRLLALHGASITVGVSPQGGARFRVELPPPDATESPRTAAGRRADPAPPGPS